MSLFCLSSPRVIHEQIEGADYKSILASIRKTCKATEPSYPIKLGGGPTGKNTYVVSVTTGPAGPSFSGGGGVAAPAAKGALCLLSQLTAPPFVCGRNTAALVGSRE
jgi:hypothetical protein